nr:MAG TPA: hypothetical protein [Caudoviricetes sp.]
MGRTPHYLKNYCLPYKTVSNILIYYYIYN